MSAAVLASLASATAAYKVAADAANVQTSKQGVAEEAVAAADRALKSLAKNDSRQIAFQCTYALALNTLLDLYAISKPIFASFTKALALKTTLNEQVAGIDAQEQNMISELSAKAEARIAAKVSGSVTTTPSKK